MARSQQLPVPCRCLGGCKPCPGAGGSSLAGHASSIPLPRARDPGHSGAVTTLGTPGCARAAPCSPERGCFPALFRVQSSSLDELCRAPGSIPGPQGPRSCRSTAGTPRAAAHGHTGPDTSPGCCRGWGTHGNPGSAACQPFPARKIGKTSSKPPGWALGPGAGAAAPPLAGRSRAGPLEPCGARHRWPSRTESSPGGDFSWI